MTLFRRLAAALLLAAGLAGCGSKPEPVADAPSEKGKPDAASAKGGEESQSDPAKAAPGKAVAAKSDRLHQTWDEATLGESTPAPDGASIPPDQLKTGTLACSVIQAVKASWDTIRFTTPSGKRIAYRATMTTTEGVIKLKLLPDLAPNHCRNFIALARAGYYDGLCFEKARSEAGEVGKFECLEGGCPKGRGDFDVNGVGYWLKDEFPTKEAMTHEEGVIGACRIALPDGQWSRDSDGCRFYVGLTKSPFLDGNHTLFGKVETGMDAVRKIFQAGVASKDPLTGGIQTPVTIQKVTITTTEE
ncbi:MAG: peptidylprolyl isomerase [Gemmataceae bacterium]|nr:peptidylprolyl isomerase [Gemmataceae bacterium]